MEPSNSHRTVWNVPNLLSAYRLIAIPLLLWLICSGERRLFAIFFLVSLITDVLDGLIARLFRLQTAFGARLDSYADLGTYVTAIIAIFVLEPTFLRTHLAAVVIIIVCYLGPEVVALLRFRRFHSMHLYTTKATAYAQGIFFISYFLIGYWAPGFYFLLLTSIVAGLEETLLLMLLPELRSDARGLYWVLRERRAHGR